MVCNRHPAEYCDYMCPTYEGIDFDFYLRYHMHGDLMDSITLKRSKIRELVLKFWDFLSINTKIDWKKFIFNNRSGATKYSKQDLIDDPKIKQIYDQTIDDLLKKENLI